MALGSNSGRSRRIRRLLQELVRDECGASAVEFAMVLPFLVMLLLGIIQYGSLFLVQTEMNSTARDTARRLSVGEIATEADAESYAVSQLAHWTPRFSAVAELPGHDEHDVIVTITVPMSEAAMIEFVGFGMDGDLKAQVHMFKE